MVDAALHALVGVQRAVVLKAGAPAATLTRLPDGSVDFTYLDGYDGPAVASTLPLGSLRRTPNGGLPPFFTNLLPEGRRLAAVREAIGTSTDDDLSMLLAVGANLVGDVTVVPADEDAATLADRTPGEAGVAGVDAESFADLDFDELAERALGPQGVRAAGMAGVQDKISSWMITLPVRGDFLLKLDPPQFPRLVENEAYFLEAARATGLRTTKAELVRDKRERPGLLVSRFDREGGARLAVEDGCQVLNVYPVQKYRVTSERTLGSLAGLCQAGRVAAAEYLDQVVFAWLTGNGDAHAKNFSVLQSAAGEWRAAPAYDLPSSYPYVPNVNADMALSIDGRKEGLTRSRMLALAVSLGVPARAAARIIDHQRDAVDAWLPGIDVIGFDERRTHKWRRFVEHRRTGLSA